LDCSQAELAQLFGKTTRTIARWTEEGLPRNKDDSYPVGPCIRWALERAEQLHAGETFTEARRRRELAQAELAELDLAKRRAQQIDSDVAVQEFGRLCEVIRSILLAAPGKHPHELLGARTLAEAQAVLEHVVREILANLKSVMLQEVDGDQRSRSRSPKSRPRRRTARRRGRGAVQRTAETHRQ